MLAPVFLCAFHIGVPALGRLKRNSRATRPSVVSYLCLLILCPYVLFLIRVLFLSSSVLMPLNLTFLFLSNFHLQVMPLFLKNSLLFCLATFFECNSNRTQHEECNSCSILFHHLPSPFISFYFEVLQFPSSLNNLIY